jgi:hypothetical protein
LTQIFGAARGIDAKTMALQYLDALKAIGASPSTKYIFPMEFTSMVSQMRGFLNESGKPGEPPAPPPSATADTAEEEQPEEAVTTSSSTTSQ